MEDWQVPLWDAINRYVVTCGGAPDKHVYGNTSRQNAVVEVCNVVREAERVAAEVAIANEEAKEVDESERRRSRAKSRQTA